MPRYSAQMLIYFIAYLSQFLKCSVGGVGAQQLWDGPLAFYHCYYDQNEVPAKDNEISLYPLLGSQPLRFCCDDYTRRIVMELAKLTDKMDKIHNHVEIINPGIKWMASLLYLWVLLLHFIPVPTSSLSATRSRLNGLVHSSLIAVKLKFQSFLQTVQHEKGEIWRWKYWFRSKITCSVVSV